MKKIISFVLAAILILTITSACLAETSIGKGSTEPIVAVVQKILTEQKFMEADRATGEFNDATKIALKRAQEYMGIKATGVIDDATLEKIGNFALIVNCKNYTCLRKSPSSKGKILQKLCPDHHKVFVLSYASDGEFSKVKWKHETGYILTENLQLYDIG